MKDADRNAVMEGQRYRGTNLQRILNKCERESEKEKQAALNVDHSLPDAGSIVLRTVRSKHHADCSMFTVSSRASRTELFRIGEVLNPCEQC